MNDAIKRMTDLAGFYVIGECGSPACALVEVEPDRTIHQLNRVHQRDGVLRADGWNDAATVICGPYLEPTTAEQKAGLV